jgi:hypothetical protein
MEVYCQDGIPVRRTFAAAAALKKKVVTCFFYFYFYFYFLSIYFKGVFWAFRNKGS